MDFFPPLNACTGSFFLYSVGKLLFDVSMDRVGTDWLSSLPRKLLFIVSRLPYMPVWPKAGKFTHYIDEKSSKCCYWSSHFACLFFKVMFFWKLVSLFFLIPQVLTWISRNNSIGVLGIKMGFSFFLLPQVMAWIYFNNLYSIDVLCINIGVSFSLFHRWFP